MRIVIDLQGAQTESRFRGVGRYSLSMAKAIITNSKNHQVIIVLNSLFPDTIESIRAYFDKLLPQENIQVWYAPGPVLELNFNNTQRREIAELTREAFIASLQPDIIYIASLFEGFSDNAVTSIGLLDKSTPVCVTSYDLIPLQNPKLYLEPNDTYKKYYMKKLQYLSKASLLFAISESSLQEVIHEIKFPKELITNTSGAVESSFKQCTLTEQESLVLITKFNIQQPFILYTGGADERKNLTRLIRAYASLSTQLREQHQLVFAGKIPPNNIIQLQAEAKKAGLTEGELSFTGYINDEELIQLYNLCKLYVFPSFHEGFGLPVLEAMSCGAAVIAANSTSLPEVIGNIDALFDPFSETDIANKMTKVLLDENLRQNLIKKGLKQAQKFSWDKSALIAIEQMESAVSTRSKKPLSPQNIKKQLLNALVERGLLNNYTDQQLYVLAQALANNHPKPRKKQLFIDVSELVNGDARTGVQRVTRSILNELLKNPPKEYDVKPVYGTHAEQGYRYTQKFNLQTSDIEDEFIQARTGDIFIGLDLQHHVVCAQKNYLLALRNRGVKIHFVVYDLLPILMPKVFSVGAGQGHQQWLSVVTQFDTVMCISHAVEKELIDWRKTQTIKRHRDFQTAWFHLGADIHNVLPSLGLPQNAHKILNTLTKTPTFLMVGTIEPRKGHKQVLDAFEQLWKGGVAVNLAIVGKQGWMMEETNKKLKQHLELNKQLFWFEGISDEYLEKVYGHSICLIAASEGEGFGLPLIEAAQHRMPVLARDIPIFREVAGQYADYFKGSEGEVLAQKIKQWLEQYKQNKHLKSEQMSWMTWQQSATQLLTKLGIN